MDTEMKRIALALALLLAPSFAWAQCTGVFPINYVCGSITGGPPKAIPFTSFPSSITPANPTATAGPAAINGVASTYMRSDAAPAVQKGSSSQFGIVECDNTSISCPGGVLSAINSGSSIQNNLLFNGNMSIDQPNVGASIALTNSINHTIDGWNVHLNSSATGVTAQQVTDAPPGFSNSLKVTIGTGAGSVAAGDFLAIFQGMTVPVRDAMGEGQSGAVASSISCWMKSSIAGTFAYFFKTPTGTRTYVAPITINSANTWQDVPLANFPNDTVGTWTPSGAFGGFIEIGLASGSTYLTNTANTWLGGNYAMITGTTTSTFLTTTGATFQLTGCRLVQGATVGPYVLRQNELQLAQQQYEKTFDITVAPGTASTAGEYAADAFSATLRFNVSPKVTKVQTPIVTLYSPNSGASSKIYDVTGAADVTASVTVNGSGNTVGFVNPATSGHQYNYHAVIDSRL
jgi:hypothetical protein